MLSRSYGNVRKIKSCKKKSVIWDHSYNLLGIQKSDWLHNIIVEFLLILLCFSNTSIFKKPMIYWIVKQGFKTHLENKEIQVRLREGINFLKKKYLTTQRRVISLYVYEPKYFILLLTLNDRVAQLLELLPRMRDIKVQSRLQHAQVVTLYNRWWQLHCQMQDNRVWVSRVLGGWQYNLISLV